MRRFAADAAVVLLAAIALSCGPGSWPDPPRVDRAAFVAEHATWRARLQQTIGEDYVELVGLWPLSEGRTSFGTDSSLPIVLPGHGSRALLGALVRNGPMVQLEPSASHRLFLNDHVPIRATLKLLTDNDSAPTTLHFGSLRLWIHVAGDRYYLRAVDTASARLRGFTLAPEYAPDLRWRVAARFDRYKRPQPFRVAEVTGAEETESEVGELVFRLAGRQFRLRAFAEPSSEKWLWLMFQDSTNRRETYGAGRYLWVPMPDSTGWTTIDFNRAISPPCAYTAFATCPLPPVENTLAVSIAAGEKRAH